MMIQGIEPVFGRCFLCNEKSERIVWRENGIAGRECSCGLLYADTGTIPKLSDAAVEAHPESFYALPARFKANWMAKRCPKGSLLEVGCGEGSFLNAARKLGYQVSGMEPHAARAAQVEKQVGIVPEPAFIEENSLPPQSFDVVYHCDLLAHFPNPIQALSAMARLLRPGGVLCFEVGTLGGISPLWYRLVGELGLGPHLFLYSKRSLPMLLDRAKLDVVTQTTFGLAPEVVLHRPLSIVLRRLIRPILKAIGQATTAEGLDRAHQWLDTSQNFLRYRVGRFFPAVVGPTTMLIVARPRPNA